MKKSICRTFLITAVILISIALLMLAVACGHEHQVNKWKTVKEPTCTTEGIARGACVECGEVVEQTIPTVKENHVYGEWEITVAPSFAAGGTGIATKTCKENPEHTIQAELPKLYSNGADYDYFEIIKEATVLEEGKIIATYNHDAGNINFTISTPKKEFDPDNCTIEDAVLIGSSNKDLIRRGTGSIASGWEDSEKNPGGFDYEYGEDYVHTVDGDDRREFWVSRTSTGEPFGVLSIVAVDGTVETTKYAKTREKHFEGYEYNVAKAGLTYYGAEDLLKNVYDLGVRNTNRDYEQGTTTTDDGETMYYFEFGYYNPSRYFCKMRCEFTLTDSYAIRYLKFRTYTFVALGDRTDQFYRVNDADNKTICYLYDNVHLNDALYKEFIIYNQVTKEEDPDEPLHEYTEDYFQIGSFDLLYKKKVYTEDTNASFTAGGTSKINFTLSNVLNASGTAPDSDINLFDYDPIKLYRITDTGRRVALSYSPDYDPVWYADGMVVKSFQITIYSKLSGTLNLLIRTESGYEKAFSVNCKPASPTVLYPMAYEYSDSGYNWNTASSNKLTTSVYIGQSISLKTTVSEEVKNYTNPGFTAEIAEGSETAEVSVIEGSDAVKFVASAAGTYVVKLRSTANTNVAATVTITVLAPPDVIAMLDGEYYSILKKFEARVRFESKDGKILAHVTTNKGEEVLSLSYDSEYKMITSEHYDGAELGTMILINEAYRLIIANPTGFGSGMEEGILYVVEEEETPEEEIQE